MAKVEFANAAVCDLDQVDDYSIGMFGEADAEIYMHGFKEAFALLAQHPFAGPPKPDLGTGLRCLVHRKHRIFYQADDDAVLVIRIIHHAMDARRVLKGAAK